MRLNTLYKKTNGNKIQEWTIEVEGPKFRTISGQTDGLKVTTEWTVCKPKNVGKANATTAEEQALNEAHAKHTKKLESGYHGAIENIEQSGFFKPMLAKTYGDYPLTFPVFSQPKLDGARCICTKAGCFSRNGKEFLSVPHINEALKGHFFFYPNAILDGELYNHELHDDFNQIISLIKKTKPTEEDLELSKKLIKYYIYDFPIVHSYGLKDNFSVRLKTFESLKLKTEGKPLVIVQTNIVNNQAELDKFYEFYMADNYEGQIIRVDGPYENKRSKYLQKRKEWQDAEWEILGLEEGEGNRTGTVGKMNFKTTDGKPFDSNVKGPFEYLEKIWKNKKEYIGKTATIKYFNLTPEGKPRFPYVIKIDRESYE